MSLQSRRPVDPVTKPFPPPAQATRAGVAFLLMLEAVPRPAPDGAAPGDPPPPM